MTTKEIKEKLKKQAGISLKELIAKGKISQEEADAMITQDHSDMSTDTEALNKFLRKHKIQK